MSTSAQVIAILMGVALTSVWVMEAFFYHDQRLHRLFLVEPEDLAAVRLWTVNVGFYNLTCAVALFVGVALLHTTHYEQAGQALILFTAAQHLFLSVVLVVVEPRLWFNSVMEGGPAALILALALL